MKGEKNPPQTGEDTWLWEREDKKEKAVARDDMRMVLELNRTRFNREGVVELLYLPSRQHASGTHSATPAA